LEGGGKWSNFSQFPRFWVKKISPEADWEKESYLLLVVEAAR
jgi:hypothetical protein